MNKPPVATPRSEGRTFGNDWSIANVAKLLRSNAARGAWRSSYSTGGYMAKINLEYIRTVSARHMPTSSSMIYMRLEDEKCWYLSLCFCGVGSYAPWNEEAAELWLLALFGQDRPLVVEEVARKAGEFESNGPRQFKLAK